jgi:hypothetical protein
MEGSGRGLIEVVSSHFPGGTAKKRITGVPAEIRTENIPNTSVSRAKFHSTLKPRHNKWIQINYHKIKALKEITFYIK